MKPSGRVAEFIGLDEVELWLLVKSRRFPPPGLVCSTSRVARLPVWERREVIEWLRSRTTRLQRPVK